MEHAVAKSYGEIHNAFKVLCRKSKMVSFASSLSKNDTAPSSWSKFPVPLIYFTAFGSISSACCLLKFVAIVL